MDRARALPLLGLVALLASSSLFCVASGEPEAITTTACVDDPRADGARFILREHAEEVSARTDEPATLSDIDGCLSTESIPDLDGDGVDDLDVSENCTWGVHAAGHLLYLSNQGCWTFAGEIIDGPLEPRASKSNGMSDIEARWSNSCLGLSFHWALYRWDGARYVVADEATCEVCDTNDCPAPDGGTQHPRCRDEVRWRALTPAGILP